MSLANIQRKEASYVVYTAKTVDWQTFEKNEAGSTWENCMDTKKRTQC